MSARDNDILEFHPEKRGSQRVIEHEIYFLVTPPEICHRHEPIAVRGLLLEAQNAIPRIERFRWRELQCVGEEIVEKCTALVLGRWRETQVHDFALFDIGCICTNTFISERGNDFRSIRNVLEREREINGIKDVTKSGDVLIRDLFIDLDGNQAREHVAWFQGF